MTELVLKRKEEYITFKKVGGIKKLVWKRKEEYITFKKVCRMTELV